MIGLTVSDYMVLEKLGEGGIGQPNAAVAPAEAR